jgi:hypothetical protein
MTLVYTSIFGDYPIAQRNDIKCFNGERIFARPVMDAKRYKILPHLYCPEESVTIWVDGNIWLLSDTKRLIERYLADGDMALFLHPARKTVWEEFAVIKKQERFQIPYLQSQLTEQETTYARAGLPKNTPLYECNFIIRRNNERVNRIMDAWWSEICRWQWRDQVSLPYVLWKHNAGFKLKPIQDKDIRKHPDFKYVSLY